MYDADTAELFGGNVMHAAESSAPSVLASQHGSNLHVKGC